jgi:exonuclease SbcD
MRKLQTRFTHCVHLEWTGASSASDGRSYRERLRGRSDLEAVTEFVRHVREVPLTAAERELVVRALAVAGGAEAAG